MTLRKQRVLFAALVLMVAMPLSAQVEKVAMRTTGISCGVCAGLSELSFRRMPGVGKVAISLSKEAIMLSYKPGATFDPAGIRMILNRLQVGVVQFQISAKGRVSEQGGKQFFIAGKNKFVVTDAEKPAAVPLDTPVLIEAILNDLPRPMEVKILTLKALPR